MHPIISLSCKLRLALVVFFLSAATVLLLLYPVAEYQKEPDTNDNPSDDVYVDALNSTLGFHKIYATYRKSHENLDGIARLLGIEIHYVQEFQRWGLQNHNQHQLLTQEYHDIQTHTHTQIYKNMLEDNIQTALILDSNVDMELGIKTQLAAILSDSKTQEFDILYLGRTHLESSEPQVQDMNAILSHRAAQRQDASFLQQQYWMQKEFVSERQPLAFPSFNPCNVAHAYALSNSMARRLIKAVKSQPNKALEDILTSMPDSKAFSASLPPIVMLPSADNSKRPSFKQYLDNSALYFMSLRPDDPSQYPPYMDWAGLWLDKQ